MYLLKKGDFPYSYVTVYHIVNHQRFTRMDNQSLVQWLFDIALGSWLQDPSADQNARNDAAHLEWCPPHLPPWPRFPPLQIQSDPPFQADSPVQKSYQSHIKVIKGINHRNHFWYRKSWGTPGTPQKASPKSMVSYQFNMVQPCLTVTMKTKWKSLGDLYP